MHKMICGKYDSLWKWDCRLNPHGLDRRTRRVRGKFATAMDYARQVRGGVAAIQHIRRQPWETWQALRG
jgi:hypothetical protein